MALETVRYAEDTFSPHARYKKITCCFLALEKKVKLKDNHCSSLWGQILGVKTKRTDRKPTFLMRFDCLFLMNNPAPCFIFRLAI